ncbi:hypothetical protein AAFC00_002337 [Neodothiora populina]|uniref:RNA-binding S4 domain-containing protein n=1 Tax=Neodothiora populina TaxID=2781224 RepID=A0ABR3PH37_9PEZI
MRKRFHGLKKPKPRQDWSKWNLYNISRMALPPASNKTFFQQKWLAKSLTRAYHGEQIREGQWTRMFDRRLPSVVPMDYRKLARSDGSEWAAGRGGGVQTPPISEVDEELSAEDKAKRISNRTRRLRTPDKTPYMHMTYHPTERRLDTAIFRALFASSTRQARQFVVHGFVKVNGKKMEYPGYLLNPGDMFSVEPERVLFATGARKYNKHVPDTLQGTTREDEPDSIIDDEAEDLVEASSSSEAAAESAEKTKESEAKDGEAGADKKQNTEAENRKAIQDLMDRAKSIMSGKERRGGLSAKRKQELRAFTQAAKKALSQIRGTKIKNSAPLNETIDGLQETLETINAKIPGTSTSASSSPPETTSSSSEPATTPSSTNPQSPEITQKEDKHATRKQAELLHAALQRAQENPIDVKKPYATPWQPREYMSAFAFIPRYLEVNQKICSAVYLRHPVARPGLAEVPTPFHGETMGLAFNWYLRRR